jgi:hypothetical protein
MRRLAFARYVYRMGLEQSRLPEPANAVAVLLLHDAAELFFQVAADHVGAQPAQKAQRAPEMIGYFDLIDPKLPPDRRLTQRLQMGRLHETRNVLKHRGVRPAAADLDVIRAGVAAFFEENAPLVFGIRVDEVTLTHLVESARAREHLAAAERHAAAGERSAAVRASAIAYAYLLHESGIRVRTADRAASGLRSMHKAEDQHLRDLAKHVERLTGTVADLQQRVAVLELGADPGRVTRFRQLTPRVAIATAGTAHWYDQLPAPELTDEDVSFCHAFVIDVALVLQRRPRPPLL